MSEILKALSDNNRLKIIKLLQEKNYCVRALSKRLGISESAVSQHLKTLKNNGIVHGVKKGYFMHYSVDTSKIESAIKILTDVILQNKTKMED